ncbi:hypothetical protein LCGC14_1867430 [marine sediment metagenome]|uniref:Bacteriophage lambda Replication protein O N-terminal domain-containing protein n=1 Tax=marine sediment metagenome TaxID=412755 RepID=A0A0F9IK21_9ZZZZ
MPKRVFDGEGAWGSDKLAKVEPVIYRLYYSWLHSLADCYGSFEITNIRHVSGKVNANIPRLTAQELEKVFQEFYKRGLAFIWKQLGRRYLHWTGSMKKGRWPRESRRTKKYEKVLAPVIKHNPEVLKQYREYLQGFDETPETSEPDAFSTVKASATDDFASALGSASASGKERETPVGFDRFWDAYPRKVGKPSAQKAWRRVFIRALSVAWDHGEIAPPRQQELGNKILAGLELWKATEQWQKDGGQFIPYPATFLNQRRWEDDPPTSGYTETHGRWPRVEPDGKCECGAEIPAGFLKCLKCMKKKAPVNP